jgi:hypothetical protein
MAPRRIPRGGVGVLLFHEVIGKVLAEVMRHVFQIAGAETRVFHGKEIASAIHCSVSQYVLRWAA